MTERASGWIPFRYCCGGIGWLARGASDVQGQGRPKVPGHATATVAGVVMCRRRLADALAMSEVRLKRETGASVQIEQVETAGWHAAIRQGSTFTGCTGAQHMPGLSELDTSE